jgi:hypothetical protein
MREAVFVEEFVRASRGLLRGVASLLDAGIRLAAALATTRMSHAAVPI